MNNDRGRACAGRIFPAPEPKTTCRVGAISTPNLSAGNVSRRRQSTPIWRPPPAPRVHRWPTAGLPGRAAGRGARGRRGRVWRSARGAAPGGTPTVAADFAPVGPGAVTRRYTHGGRPRSSGSASGAVTRRYTQREVPRPPTGPGAVTRRYTQRRRPGRRAFVRWHPGRAPRGPGQGNAHPAALRPGALVRRCPAAIAPRGGASGWRESRRVDPAPVRADPDTGGAGGAGAHAGIPERLRGNRPAVPPAGSLPCAQRRTARGSEGRKGWGVHDPVIPVRANAPPGIVCPDQPRPGQPRARGVPCHRGGRCEAPHAPRFLGDALQGSRCACAYSGRCRASGGGGGTPGGTARRSRRCNAALQRDTP